MNGVGRLARSEVGDSREPPIGSQLRQEESGKEEGFKSVLSRMSGSASGLVASLESEGSGASILAADVSDHPAPMAGARRSDDVGAAADMLLMATGEIRSSLRLTDSAPINDWIVTRDVTFAIAPDIAAAAIEEIAQPVVSVVVLGEPVEREFADPPETGGFPMVTSGMPTMEIMFSKIVDPVSVVADPHPVSVETVSPISNTDDRRGRRVDLIPFQENHLIDATSRNSGAEIEQSMTMPERSRVTVIAQEKHLAPARRPDPARLSLPVSDPQADVPAIRGEEPSGPAGPVATGRDDHLVRTADPQPTIEPKSKPQTVETETPSHRSAGVTPASTAAMTSSTEGTAAPTSGFPGLPQGVLQRIAGAVLEAAASAPMAAPAVTAADQADHSLAPAAIRALTIHVDLPEHGVLHVRLALNGNALSLRLRADREEVAEQLRQDHAKLSEVLSAAGYDAEIVAIEGRRNEIVSPLRNDPAQPVEPGANGAANTDQGNGGGERRPTARQIQTANQGFDGPAPHQNQNPHETRNPSRRAAGALYV